MIHPWKIVQSELLLDCRIFKVRQDRVVSPRTKKTHEMYVLENPTWVNIIPLTLNDEVIMVEQWRHGTRMTHIETPGGIVEENEAIENCANRELLEETGYKAEKIIPLGSVYPNPAIQNNRQYYVLGTNCTKVAEPKLDPAEDIQVHLVPLTEIRKKIQLGIINHTIVITGFYRLELFRNQPSN